MTPQWATSYLTKFELARICGQFNYVTAIDKKRMAGRSPDSLRSSQLTEQSRLIGAVGRNDGRKRFEHQFQIEPVAAILDICHIQFELLLKWQTAPPGNLPNAG